VLLQFELVSSLKSDREEMLASSARRRWPGTTESGIFVRRQSAARGEFGELSLGDWRANGVTLCKVRVYLDNVVNGCACSITTNRPM